MSRTEKEEAKITNLPSSLIDAVEELEKSAILKQALGEHVFASFCANKRKEYEKYSLSVHQWEIDTYMKSF